MKPIPVPQPLCRLACDRQSAGTFETTDDHCGQALGFSLYLVKAVLSGRGDEVIDLVKTNLFR